MSKLALIIVFLMALPFGFVQAGPAFEPGEVGASNLKTVQGMPFMTLQGSPEALGKAQGELLRKEVVMLVRSFLKPASLMAGGLEHLKKQALKMESHVPPRYLAELKAMAKASGQDYETLLTGCAFPDVYRGGGCSTLAALPPAVKGGQPLLARNLDFFPMGVLDKYGLIVVYKPDGYNAFASVSWPCLNGVLSGMNDKGLCCAVMEVRTGKRSNSGMPSMFLFRRVMEEAATVKEALAILEKEKKVASNNLILLDTRGGAAVAEIGPGYCAVRKPEKDMVFATNHHRYGIKPAPGCRRYHTITDFCKENHGKIDVPLLKDVLDKVNQGMISIQSMIFEPAAMKLHISMGKIPSTKGTFKTFSFAKAFKADGSKKQKTVLKAKKD
ncbi:MAG: C45 family autoproteolytic acyltransferase/hydrolase [Planctomycetota bacterium]|jgi:hypothetical protein